MQCPVHRNSRNAMVSVRNLKRAAHPDSIPSTFPIPVTVKTHTHRLHPIPALFNHIHYYSIGHRDFVFFFTFLVITTHPWHPNFPGIWKMAKKISTSSMACKIFRKMRFFCKISKFNFRNPFWRIFPRTIHRFLCLTGATDCRKHVNKYNYNAPPQIYIKPIAIFSPFSRPYLFLLHVL